MKENKQKRMLLHCCCAPCVAYVIELLKPHYNLSLFFYNPNIHPEYEYKKRLKELKSFCLRKGVELLLGDYEINSWFEKIEGHEKDPEKGERCKICYYNRLAKTVSLAKKEKFDIWGTTLTISPHKSEIIINFLGNELGEEYGIEFLKSNFKKKGGFQKSLEISRKYGFYRQNYCGCIYSQIGKLNAKKDKCDD